jgi:hypothetical protein
VPVPEVLVASRSGVLLAGGGSDGTAAEEGSEVLEEVRLLHTEVVVEEEEKLTLHEVDLGGGEEGAVASPVLVLRRRVVEVLGGGDEDGEEDAVAGAVHALGDLGETGLQALEVDESAHEGGDLDIRLLDEDGDEGLERGDGGLLSGLAVLEASLGGSVGRGGESGGGSGTALDDLDSLFSEESWKKGGKGERRKVKGEERRQRTDHLLSNRGTNELEESRVVEVLGEEGGRVTASLRRSGLEGHVDSPRRRK